jgi:hypothetical protein
VKESQVSTTIHTLPIERSGSSSSGFGHYEVVDDQGDPVTRLATPALTSTIPSSATFSPTTELVWGKQQLNSSGAILQLVGGSRLAVAVDPADHAGEDPSGP